MKILNNSQAENIVATAVTRMVNYFIEAGTKCIVEGASGGVDSTFVMDLGLMARDRMRILNHPIDTYYVFLNVESHPDDLARAQEFAALRGFQLHYHDLTELYRDSLKYFRIPSGHPYEKIEKGNLKCRLRMMFLMDRAKRYDGIYLDTDDLSEYWMGFWTRHGDEGDLKIIQQFTKDEVYDLAEYCRAPASILRALPGDGLGVSINNLASDQLGLPYMMTDFIISKMKGLVGLDTNGATSQLELEHIKGGIRYIASVINKPVEKVEAVVRQCLRTAYKRRYGENVAELLPSRREMGLPIIGSNEFNELYLSAIKKYS